MAGMGCYARNPKRGDEMSDRYFPPNTRVRYQGDFWTVLGQGEYVTIVNERSGRLLAVMADLLEVAI